MAGASVTELVKDPKLSDLPVPRVQKGWMGWVRYFPPWEFDLPGIYRIMKWNLSSEHRHRPPVPPQDELDKVFPVVTPDFGVQGLYATWLGHASVMFTFPNGARVFCDPVFSERVSPVKFAGPKRFRRVPCTIEELPAITAVCISHNHLDHCDTDTLKQLIRSQPDIQFCVALGERSRLVGLGATRVQEMSWWETLVIPCEKEELRVTMTPANHWCCRNYVSDYNCSLWGSYVMKVGDNTCYFGGDTGYQTEIFNLIGQKYGPFQLAAIPIGAYKPRDVMQAQHVSPKEAVMIHKDIHSLRSLGIHWGTFQLADEPVFEPREMLEEESKKQGVPPGQFTTVNIGASLTT